VHEGRVQTLLVKEGFRAPGYRCKGCGYMTAEKAETCPFCGNQFEEIPDAVELVVRRVMQDGGDVEILHDANREELGGIGALLRY
jgi:peptide subunit release factor 1 (eRF1)